MRARTSKHANHTFEGEKRVSSADFASGMSCTPTVADWHLHEGALRGPEGAKPLFRPWQLGSLTAPTETIWEAISSAQMR